MRVIFRAVIVGQYGTQQIELWQTLLWVSSLATIAGVLFLTRLLRRKPPAARLKAGIAIGLVVCLWGSYRVASDFRWRVNGLGDEIASLIEVSDRGAITKGELKIRPRCGAGEVTLRLGVVGAVAPPIDGPGRGELRASSFAVLEQLSGRLEDQGWTVRRFEFDDPDSGEVEGLLSQAKRGDEYVVASFFEGRMSVSVFLEGCLVSFFKFWDETNPDGLQTSVPEFHPGERE